MTSRLLKLLALGSAYFACTILSTAAAQQDSPAELFSSVMSAMNENTSLTATDVKRISKSGSTYVIPADLRPKALLSLPALARQATIRKVSLNKKPAGFRIEKIATGSVFHALGIKVGDVIQSINGHSVTAEERALELVTQLSNERSFVLALLRGEKLTPIKLFYKVS